MLKHQPKNLTPEQLIEYEAIVASCRYVAPPKDDSWPVVLIGTLLLINLFGAAALLT